MIFSIEETVTRVAAQKPTSGAGHPAPRIVICQPSALYAQAVAALLKKHGHWEVVCTTTDMTTAISAAANGRAEALMFESVLGTARGVAALIRRLRTACPGVSLILFTEHGGARFSASALRAGIGACVRKQDSPADFYTALGAVEQGSGGLARRARDAAENLPRPRPIGSSPGQITRRSGCVAAGPWPASEP